MKIYISLSSAEKISLKDATDRHLFGPVWHGTNPSSQELIDTEGFKIFKNDAGSRETKNGFSKMDYPVHTLGYGIYFTTSKANAAKYAGSGRKLKTYYLDVPRLETINFAAENTIMRWWKSNGFDPVLNAKDRVLATQKMTETLMSKFDAVYQKAKAMGGKGFDCNQICVYDVSRIYEIDESLSKGLDIGAKVKRKSDGMTGIILKATPFGNVEYMIELLTKRLTEVEPMHYDHIKERLTLFERLEKLPEDKRIGFEIRWKKGGTEYQVPIFDVEEKA